MKTQISRDVKLRFLHCWLAMTFITGTFFALPLLRIWIDMHNGNLRWADLISAIGLPFVAGTLLALLFTRLYSRRIGPGRYTPERGGGVKEFTLPTWVTRGCHDQLSHFCRRTRRRMILDIVPLFLLGTAAFFASMVLFALGINHQAALWSADSNILNAPQAGRLLSITPPGPIHPEYSPDTVYIEYDNRLWYAPTDQVLVTYDEGMQELLRCSQRFHQEGFFRWQPGVKLEKLGRIGAGSGDNREVVKISLLDP